MPEAVGSGVFLNGKEIVAFVLFCLAVLPTTLILAVWTTRTFGKIGGRVDNLEKNAEERAGYVDRFLLVEHDSKEAKGQRNEMQAQIRGLETSVAGIDRKVERIGDHVETIRSEVKAIRMNGAGHSA